MNLTPYLDAVAADLEKATALADESTRDVAHRLLAALEPGLRLALVRAVSDTATRITAELDDAVATVTMAGQEPLVTVTRTAAAGADRTCADEHASPGREPAADDDGGDLVRITLRLPEQLKTRAEERADRAGQSLNTWLVQTVRRATDTRPAAPPVAGSRRHTGWA